MAGLILDVTPLRRVPAYRRLWVGNALSSIGSSMTVYAVPLQVWMLTHSSFAVGLLGLAIAVPTVVVASVGGVIVDSVDRRRLVLVCTSIHAALSVVLAVQAYGQWDRLSVLYGVTVVSSVVGGLNAPARRTFMPALLGAEQIGAGAALQVFSIHGALMVGPALAGLVTAAGGLRVCFVIDACSFAFSLYGVARLPRLTVPRGDRPGPRAIAEGFRFIGHHRPVLGALLADASATLFGMPVALFPALNAERFGADPTTLGLLSTAVAVGGVLGSGLSGRTGRTDRRGLGMLIAGSVWGLGIVAFGLTWSYPAALAALVLAGAADSTSVVLRTSLVQSLTPDRLRGRVTGAELAVGMGIAQLGNTEAGAVAAVTSTTVSIVSGGLACVVAAGLIGVFVPSLARHKASDPIEADPSAQTSKS